MEDFIGKKVDDVILELNKKGLSYNIINNNHIVENGTLLVTNAVLTEDKTVTLTVGEFIFNLKDKKD